MLESMRQRGASIFIYLIFGILIAVFVINFGPSGGQGGGCSSSGNSAVEVDGSDVNLTAFRVAMGAQNQGNERERKYRALDLLIRREILAQAGEAHGIRVSGDMVDEEIKQGFFFLGGTRIPLGENIFDYHPDGTRTWSGAKFKRWVSNLDVRSLSSYRDEQTRSMQATLMAEMLAASARASREEALSDFLFASSTVTYNFVEFAPQAYRQAMKLTAADVERFAQTHETEVKAKFTADEVTYKGTKPALKIRQIFIAKAESLQMTPDAGSGAAPTPPKPEDTVPGKPQPVESATALLEKTRTEFITGKTKLSDVASKWNTDENNRSMGGLVGWRSAENPALGDPKVNEAVKALKPGEVTPVIATDAGVYLVTVEEKREGDLSFDAVKMEIAESLARDVWSKEAAKRAAIAALAASSTTPLDKQFPPDFQMSPEMQRDLLKNLDIQMAPKSGSIVWESDDVPAKSYAQADGAGGSGSAAAGSAAAGSAAAGAPAEPPTTAPAIKKIPESMVATSDQLPTFGDASKPQLQAIGPETRKAVMPGLDVESTKLLYDVLQVGKIHQQVLEVNGNYVVLELTDRGDPKAEDFDKKADAMLAAMNAARGQQLVEDFVVTKCKQLQKEDKLHPAASLITEFDDKGNAVPTTFRPCTNMK